jgi:hypothetical protein
MKERQQPAIIVISITAMTREINHYIVVVVIATEQQLLNIMIKIDFTINVRV